MQAQTRSLTTTLTDRLRSIHWCCWLLAAGAFLAPTAHAGFISPYALADFTLVNQNADGTAVTLDGGLSVILTGGNTGSGLGGTTDLVATALASGLVHFQYSFFSLDLPTFDASGYLLDGVFTQLSDTSGDAGTVDLPVISGQTFGFRVSTFDNFFEPGVLTLTDFSGPTGADGTATPEPGGWPLAFVVLSALAVAGRMKRAHRKEQL